MFIYVLIVKINQW